MIYYNKIKIRRKIHAKRGNSTSLRFILIMYSYQFRAWGGVVVKALFGRSQDRSPVVSLGIISMASDNSNSAS
jgi:hypothetical protein